MMDEFLMLLFGPGRSSWFLSSGVALPTVPNLSPDEPPAEGPADVTVDSDQLRAAVYGPGIVLPNGGRHVDHTTGEVRWTQLDG